MPAGIDEEYARAIGREIAAARKRRSLTQDDLRRRIGNSKNAVSNWERGVSAPTVQNLRALCRALDIGPAQLLGIDVKMRGSTSVVAEASAHATQLGNRLAVLRESAETTVPDLLALLRAAEVEVHRILRVLS